MYVNADYRDYSTLPVLLGPCEVVGAICRIIVGAIKRPALVLSRRDALRIIHIVELEPTVISHHPEAWHQKVGLAMGELVVGSATTLNLEVFWTLAPCWIWAWWNQ